MQKWLAANGQQHRGNIRQNHLHGNYTEGWHPLGLSPESLTPLLLKDVAIYAALVMLHIKQRIGLIATEKIYLAKHPHRSDL